MSRCRPFFNSFEETTAAFYCIDPKTKITFHSLSESFQMSVNNICNTKMTYGESQMLYEHTVLQDIIVASTNAVSLRSTFPSPRCFTTNERLWKGEQYTTKVGNESSYRYFPAQLILPGVFLSHYGCYVVFPLPLPHRTSSLLIMSYKTTEENGYTLRPGIQLLKNNTVNSKPVKTSPSTTSTPTEQRCKSRLRRASRSSGHVSPMSARTEKLDLPLSLSPLKRPSLSSYMTRSNDSWNFSCCIASY